MVDPYKLRHRDLEKLMHTYKVILEITVKDDAVAEESQVPMTRSHKNALLRKWVWVRVAAALEQYNFDLPVIKSVVKVQTKKEGSK